LLEVLANRVNESMVRGLKQSNENMMLEYSWGHIIIRTSKLKSETLRDYVENMKKVVSSTGSAGFFSLENGETSEEANSETLSN